MSFFQPKQGDDVKSRRLPWSEKYRPKTLGDVAAQDAVVQTLQKTIQNANLPHMLFYGPPGTGKTSTILALAKDLYGPELFKSRVLELNASNERGIAVVRDKIKSFAKSAIAAPSEAVRAKYPAPPFKIIILDEADSMTQDAQSALRRTMETYSKYTRFCLVCNYVTRIIDPIASRCSKFRFKPLDQTNAVSRLEFIVENEHVEVADDTLLPRLLEVSSGDLRKAITLLQSSRGLAGGENKPITSDIIDEVSGTVPESLVLTLIAAIKKRDFRNLEGTVRNVVLEGWSVTQLIDQLHDVILYDSRVSAEVKTVTAMSLSEADRQLSDGADEEIILLNVAAGISDAWK